MMPPQYPAGLFAPDSAVNPESLIAEIESFPRTLRGAVVDLSDQQIDTRYKNWTIRQIVHHLADSHVNSYVRFKWTLTEDRPTIKAYQEGDWANLEDSRTGAISAPLALLDGLHARWAQLLKTLSADQFQRMFFHPQTKENVTLDTALRYYVWHGKHHLGQIQWLRMQNAW